MRFGTSWTDSVYEAAVTRSRSERFGSEVRRRLLQGAWIHGDGAQDEHYQRALRIRRVIHNSWLRLFDDIDVLIMPVTGEAPFRRGRRSDDAMAMRRSDEWTVAANVTGLPAISLPMGKTDHGLPRAVQLLAGPFKEELLFTAAAKIEAMLNDSEGKHEQH
jgi:aspartyl-tRNA(Asn)/glutamyl-tRNA(Gln) amidotransferase subunit A